ncbi:TetR family transcriptional regulator [Aestuariicella hydrocarbonica]|uniref:TetR family transcriptional regulator n=1 Tax=Pseudomaricurvus hydrocarbonicus TaxID=1470433 RepID=A0A9E5JTG2_9GAMM|nr:TetR/AcrR family transcriptional regulator [Aestuariicella hydrocarbonica]NHO66239.1 TetR family transcriptional regulator [Aestuariicella hydrocarbonica]
MIVEVASHHPHKTDTKKRAGRVRKKKEKIIFDAAELEFAEKGYEGATMDSIAKRAGLARPNVHYYFDNKLKLYAEILSSILELWDTALNDIRCDDHPYEALRTYITQKIEFSRNHPLSSRIFAREIISGAPHLKEYYQQEYQQWFGRKLEIFESWSRSGKIDAVDPAHLMFLIWSSTQHYADFEAQVAAAMGKAELANEDYRSAAETLTAVITKGIGCSPQATAVTE